MKSTRRFWSSLLTLLVCISYYGRTDAACKPIPLDSVKAAITACIVAYKDCELIEDQPMKDPTTNMTTGFKIEKVLREDYRGVPIVAFRASDATRTVIAFRGTKSKRQLVDELKAAAEAKEKVEFKATAPTKVGILPYFYNAYQALNASRLLPDGIEETRKYIITGHSLGGALASIFALDQNKRFGTDRSKDMFREDLENVLITFGQPRVGNNAYADSHDTMIPFYKKLRFVDKRDPVATLPKTPLESMMRRGFHHHGTKILLSDNKIKVCPFGDNPKACRKFDFRGISYHKGKQYKATIESNTAWMDEFGNSHPSFEESQCLSRNG